GVCQHEARSHMASDLARYLFSSCFAHSSGYSARLDIFPPKLLPEHSNVHVEGLKAIPFKDRFRVQCRNEPAATVVAHIAKDGHYYIHYDPAQCRSLTVREAARLQTFPDNYFFSGNRTEQYTQVGNAVPPLLAHKLAKVVRGLLNQMSRKKRREMGDSPQKSRTATACQLPARQVQVPLLVEAN
ncbi:DNA cytosine methyltransferase, partial [Hydrogenophaga sp.]|uniref:DNA cytosine methyltransferase n=1 Tax=Hydrogenophaga sp. TaxID=1904254 RepID=UPI002730F36A